MPGLSSLALALSVALAPQPAADSSGARELGLDECREQGLDFFLSFGPAAAPTVLKVYVDPTAPDQLQMWLEARRIAGERPEELRLEMIVARGGVSEGDPEADALRLWFMAVADLGAAEDALRLLERQDWRRTASQLETPETRAELAAELGLEAALVEDRLSGTSRTCLARSLDRAAHRLASRVMGRGPATTVVGIVDADGNELLQGVDRQLTDLRTQLDRARRTTAFVDEAMAFVPYGPTMQGRTSRYDRTFPETGVLVGGRALPHHLLVFVEDEEHGNLPGWLAPAMAYRTRNPGVLSVQVIAAGVGTRAIMLRRRLCAARTLGLEVEYLNHLALRPAARRLHETQLYEVLQPVADSDACSDSEPLDTGPEPAEGGSEGSRRGSDFGHPRGAWLDGRPVQRGDLESLEWQLGNEVEPSLIDWLAQPDALIGESFEFDF